MGSIDRSSLLREINTQSFEESPAGWSSDENATQGTAGDSWEGTPYTVLPFTSDAATPENSAAFPHLRSTESPTTPAKDKNTNRRLEKWLFLPSAFALALVSFFALCFHARSKLPRAIQGPDRSVDSVLDGFVNTFVTAKSEFCFTSHEAFTAETAEAKLARDSFQEWINKAQLWRDTIKSKGVAAAALSIDVEPPAEKTPELPQRWELLLLEGAVTCYNVPEVEERAKFCPYFPLRHGRYKYQEVDGHLVLSARRVKRKDREEATRLAEAQQALQASTTQISSWVSRMQKELQQLLAAKSERARDVSTGALKEKDEEDLKQLDQALAFYDMLRLYTEKRALPPRPSSGEPASDYLKRMDLYIMRVMNVATKAFSCATRGAADRSGKEPADPRMNPPNKYIPYWLPHLLFSRHNQTMSSYLGLRLQAAVMGRPAFATAKKECLAEFAELLNRTLLLQEKKERLKFLEVGSPRRKKLVRQVTLTDLQAELAVAAYMIEAHSKTAREQKDISPSARATSRSAVVNAWRRQEAICLRWKQKAENGELPIATEEAQELAIALQHVINGALLARRLALVVEGTEEAKRNQHNVDITSGLLAVCQLKVAQAARGPLHEKGILPAWFAHILG